MDSSLGGAVIAEDLAGSDLPENLGGGTGGEAVGWDVGQYYGVCPNRCVIADGEATEDLDPWSDKNIVADLGCPDAGTAMSLSKGDFVREVAVLADTAVGIDDDWPEVGNEQPWSDVGPGIKLDTRLQLIPPEPPGERLAQHSVSLSSVPCDAIPERDAEAGLNKVGAQEPARAGLSGVAAQVRSQVLM